MSELEQLKRELAEAKEQLSLINEVGKVASLDVALKPHGIVCKLKDSCDAWQRCAEELARSAQETIALHEAKDFHRVALQVQQALATYNELKKGTK